MQTLNDDCSDENNETYEDNKCCKIFERIIQKIVEQYFRYLVKIGFQNDHHPSNNVLGKNKFAEVRQSFYEFLDMHKNFVLLKRIVLENNGTKQRRNIRICYSDHLSKFLDNNYFSKSLDYYSKHCLDIQHEFHFHFIYIYKRKNTLKSLKGVFKLEQISGENMVNFKEKYVIGNQSSRTSRTVLYQQFEENLENSYLT